MNRRAGQAPGTMEVRLSGTAEDTATVVSVMERVAAGLNGQHPQDAGEAPPDE